MTATPTHSGAEIAGSVGEAVEDIREALDGADIHVQALVISSIRRPDRGHLDDLLP
ncbi:hypothetical protein [Gordonia sp. SID5947]|uniref:hypothetical protein n=1 Tax=Gordonia sp. SID5947 TaxID=2690315 RepID=UPI001F196055|nr:hypothetical protein [Gordonia sp. SID5947]